MCNTYGGPKTLPVSHLELRTSARFTSGKLEYQDSNLDELIQNQSGCQLPHTPSSRGFDYR